jgi:hypothetical protein
MLSGVLSSCHATLDRVPCGLGTPGRLHTLPHAAPGPETLHIPHPRAAFPTLLRPLVSDGPPLPSARSSLISPLPPANPTHPRLCEDLIPSSCQSFELRPVDSEGQGAFPVDSEVCGLPLSVPGEEDRSHGRHLGLSSATLRGQPRQFAIRRPPDDDAHDCPCLGEIQRKGQQTTHPKW